MPADRADLERRIAAATPQDTVRGVVFKATSKLLREHLGEVAARACDPGKGSRVDFLSYPVEDYLRLAWAGVDALEPRLGSVDAGFFAIGEAAMRDVFGTLLGRTLLSLAGDDMRQLLSQVGTGYKATVGYGERTVDWPGERSAHFVFRRDFLVPAFHCGVLAAAAKALGGRDVLAQGRPTGFLDLEVDLTWS
ncbi:TIGR02265 family protein [Anaeromyxobacter diazotrophicus]|uniref:TIGR02265 family protein n=1 Tax=Anaeromyxobacter diazotrophicus TaxID=2590199 RepID=A0A7I9VSZ7_9BACT|nr:TIGR02265 family protein [Anaeromyxobacter diazotrophicus]GEJ59348.1 hypothetical protein AMYX_40890 [Anaeromyxobacter diazotrophicus]